MLPVVFLRGGNVAAGQVRLPHFAQTFGWVHGRNWVMRLLM